VSTGKEYADCFCAQSNQYADGSNLNKNNQTILYAAKYCSTNIQCIDKLIVNGLAAFVIIFLTAMSIVPHIKAVVGSVKEEILSFSLGMRACITSLLGNFAGTLIVGQSVDLSCKFWLTNCFGQKVCMLYDNYKMAQAMALIGFGCRFLSFFFMLIAVLIILLREKRNPSKSKNETMSLEPTTVDKL